MNQETLQPDVSPTCLGRRLGSEPFLADRAGVPQSPGPQLSHRQRPRALPHAQSVHARPECEDWATHTCTPAGSELPYPGHHSTVGELSVMSKTSERNTKPPAAPYAASLLSRLLPQTPRGKGHMCPLPPWTPCGEAFCVAQGDQCPPPPTDSCAEALTADV